MSDTVQAPPTPAAAAKPKGYRCPNASYTITPEMCVGRQQTAYHLCPKCACKAPLPSGASAN